MKGKGDHDEPVAINEVVDDEAVACMYDLAVNEVMVMRQRWDTMAISEEVDALAFDEGVDDATGIDERDDDEAVDDEGVDDAMEVDEGDDDEAVDDEVVDDAMGVDGAVDDGEVVDEAVGEPMEVDDAMVVYEGVDDAMVDDEEVVDEKLQLDVDTVVELHFQVLLLGIQSTENKRKCEKNVTGHCKFPHWNQQTHYQT